MAFTIQAGALRAQLATKIQNTATLAFLDSLLATIANQTTVLTLAGTDLDDWLQNYLISRIANKPHTVNGILSVFSTTPAIITPLTIDPTWSAANTDLIWQVRGEALAMKADPEATPSVLSKIREEKGWTIGLGSATFFSDLGKQPQTLIAVTADSAHALYEKGRNVLAFMRLRSAVPHLKEEAKAAGVEEKGARLAEALEIRCQSVDRLGKALKDKFLQPAYDRYTHITKVLGDLLTASLSTEAPAVTLYKFTGVTIPAPTPAAVVTPVDTARMFKTFEQQTRTQFSHCEDKKYAEIWANKLTALKSTGAITPTVTQTKAYVVEENKRGDEVRYVTKAEQEALDEALAHKLQAEEFMPKTPGRR